MSYFLEAMSGLLKTIPFIGACLICISGQAACQVVPEESCDGPDPICNPLLALLLATHRATASLSTCQGAQSTNFARIFGTSNNDIPTGICGLESGDFLLTGYAEADLTGVPVLSPGTAGLNGDVFVARANSAGELIWVTYFGSTGNDIPLQLTRTGKDRFVVAAYTSTGFTSMQGKSPVEPHSGSDDFLIISFDGNGGLLWYTFLGGTGTENVSGAGYDEIEDRLFYAGTTSAGITGESGQSPIYPAQGGSDCALFRLDPGSGVLQWFTHIGGTGTENCQALTIGNQGGPVVTGGSVSTSLTTTSPLNGFSGSTGEDVFVASYTVDGYPRWNTFFGTADTNNERGKGIVRMANGSFVTASDAQVGITSIGGLTPIVPYPGAVTNNDTLVTGFSASGTALFYTYHGVTGSDDTTQSIFPIADGGFAVLSLTNNTLSSFNGLTPRVAQATAAEGSTFKYNAAGQLLWYSFNRGSNSHPVGAPLRDGGLVIVSELTSALGTYDSATVSGGYNGNSDVFFLRTNSEGLMQ